MTSISLLQTAESLLHTDAAERAFLDQTICDAEIVARGRPGAATEKAARPCCRRGAGLTQRASG
jgi:hypothetical protein